MATTNVQWFPGDVKVTSNLSVDTNTLHVDSVANRVGIGKTDPGFNLDVNGIVNGTDILLNGAALSDDPWSTSGSNSYYTTGNVGISTTSPTANLHVEGTLRVSNVSGNTSDLYTTTVSSFTNEGRLSPSDMESSELFGNLHWADMSRGDGSYIIAGSESYDGLGFNYGAAFVWVRNGSSWSQQQRLHPGVARSFGRGCTLNSDGTVAAVGCGPGQVPGYSGTVSIWRRNGSTWSKDDEFGETGNSNFYGWSNSLSGDGSYLLVGDPLITNVNFRDGSAYIYTYNGSTWSKQATFTPSSPEAGGWFGQNVRLSSDATYAYIETQGGYSSGTIEVHTRSPGGTTWTYQATITPSIRNTRDYFGRYKFGFSADNSYLVVGAYGITNVEPGRQAGRAFVFVRSGSSWSEQQALQTTTVATDYSFRRFGVGCDMSPDGTTVYIGSNRGAPTGGYLFKFTRSGSTWTQTDAYVTSPAPTSAPQFCNSVVVVQNDGSRVVTNDNNYSSSRGSLNPFRLISPYLTVTTPIKAKGTVLSFTGQHTCFPDGPLSQGQIVSANKNKYVSLNGPLTTGLQAIKSSESLPVVSLSNVANDTTVFGVVDHVENGGNTRSQKSGVGVVTQDKELGDNRVVVNSLGEGAIWVVNTNGNLVSGDYITTSNIAGYGQKQDDSDTLYSYTVAKITMDCDFNPQDVPIQVIKKDENGQNILDSYGRIQWEDRVVMEKAYKIRYLTVDGKDTDEANSVWTAAYVGCTYHCG